MGSGLLSPEHLIVLLVIALLVFGPKRLPELGRSLGSGMRGFKDAISGESESADRPAPTQIEPAPTEPPLGPQAPSHTA